MKRLKFNIWYHGSKEKLGSPLRSLYLTPSKALAELYGDVYAFTIDATAKWLDIDKVEHFVPSMDAIGYSENWIEKLKNKEWDVVWDSEDYKRGHHQIFVLNPNILKSFDIKQESFKRVINKLVAETIKEIIF